MSEDAALDQPSGEPRDVESGLISSAAMWIAEAITAWAEDKYSKVAAAAPLAVEHLGKAVLWRTNPVLLVPLTSNGEPALIVLATRPSLTHSKVRTVELATLLSRLQVVLTSLPIDPARQKRLVGARNGAVHVGTAEPSRHVLVDSLALCQTFLRHLGVSEAGFFGDHYSHVVGLLDAQRTETGHRVAVKRARAGQRIIDLRDQLGVEMYLVTRAGLEARARLALKDLDPYSQAVERPCPECCSVGLLWGTVDVDFDVDFDVESLGGGQYEPVPYSISIISLSPTRFACNVCQLGLVGREELAEAGLPTARMRVEENELGPDFEISFFIYDVD